MPDLQDVLVASPIGAHKHAEATHAEIEELRGMITLLRDVHVHQPLIVDEEYTITSRATGHTLHARYVGPHHAIPGALVFGAIPQRISKTYGRI